MKELKIDRKTGREEWSGECGYEKKKRALPSPPMR
jgi:hypothetical protein